jgi:hypothetical protein
VHNKVSSNTTSNVNKNKGFDLDFDFDEFDKKVANIQIGNEKTTNKAKNVEFDFNF